MRKPEILRFLAITPLTRGHAACNPDNFELNNGIHDCRSCAPPYKIKADVGRSDFTVDEEFRR